MKSMLICICVCVWSLIVVQRIAAAEECEELEKECGEPVEFLYRSGQCDCYLCEAGKSSEWTQCSEAEETKKRLARQAVATIIDKDLDDAAKEKETQAAAIDTLKNAFFLLMKLMVIFGAAAAPIWLADIAGIAELSEISAFALRLDILLITTTVASAIVLLGRKLSKKR